MKNYIGVDGIRVHRDVLTAKFACDYEKCKGACCWIPSDVLLLGGEVTYEEAEKIRRHSEDIKSVIHPKNLTGFTEHQVVKFSEKTYTPLDSSGACIFCNGGCAIREIVDIPHSCELYPLLVEDNTLKLDNLSPFGDYCKYGFEKGDKDNIYLLHFCMRGIVRKFGLEFYNELLKEHDKLIS